MNQELTRWALSHLILAAIALMVGCNTYLILRVAEKRYQHAVLIISGFGSPAILLAINLFASRAVVIAFFIACLVGLAGARFHLVSNGKSTKFSHAFFLMVFAILVSGCIESFLLVWTNFPLASAPRFLSFLDRFYFDLFFIVSPVFLTPFSIWAWKNSKLRPGVDRHLKDGESER